MALAEAPWLKDISEGIVGKVSGTDAFPVCHIAWEKDALELGKLVTICTHDPEAPVQFWAGIICGQGVRILNSDYNRVPPDGSFLIDTAKWREFINLSERDTALIGKKGSGKTFLSKLLLQTHLDISHHRPKKEKLIIFDTTGEFVVPWSEAPPHKGFIQRAFVNRLAIFSNSQLGPDLEMRKASSMNFDFREFTPFEVRAAFSEDKESAEAMELRSLSRREWNRMCEHEHEAASSELRALIQKYHLPNCPLKLNLITTLLNPSIDALVLDLRDVEVSHRKSFVDFVVSILEDYNERQSSFPVKEEDDFLDLSISSGSFTEDGKLQIYRDELKCLIVQDVTSHLRTKFPALRFFEKDEDCKGIENRIYLYDNHICSFLSRDFNQELLFETFENVVGTTLLETVPCKQAQNLTALKEELFELGLETEEDVISLLNSPKLRDLEEGLPTFLRFMNSSIVMTSDANGERNHRLNLFLLAELEKKK